MPHPANTSGNADTTIGSGIESGIVLVLFVLAGYGLDRWLGTRPVFTLILFALGAVGLFYRFKSQYTMRMDALAEERRAAAERRDTGRRHAARRGETDGHDAAAGHEQTDRRGGAS